MSHGSPATSRQSMTAGLTNTGNGDMTTPAHGMGAVGHSHPEKDFRSTMCKPTVKASPVLSMNAIGVAMNMKDTNVLKNVHVSAGAIATCSGIPKTKLVKTTIGGRAARTNTNAIIAGSYSNVITAPFRQVVERSVPPSVLLIGKFVLTLAHLTRIGEVGV